jgi:hypothetical protein
MRYALIFTTSDAVAAYLPSNYRVVDVDHVEGTTVIAGDDVAGWTLEGYVLPRLASGLYFGEPMDAVVV